MPGLILLTTAFVLSTLLFTKVVLKCIMYYIFKQMNMKEEIRPGGPVQLVVTVTCMHILQCCMEIVH